MTNPDPAKPSADPFRDVWTTLLEVVKRLIALEKNHATTKDEIATLRSEIGIIDGKHDQRVVQLKSLITAARSKKL